MQWVVPGRSHRMGQMHVDTCRYLRGYRCGCASDLACMDGDCGQWCLIILLCGVAVVSGAAILVHVVPAGPAVPPSSMALSSVPPDARIHAPTPLAPSLQPHRTHVTGGQTSTHSTAGLNPGTTVRHSWACDIACVT